MLANTTYNSLSGTSVSWDFVELPSQVLENWCYEKEALEIFAKHYETDEVIPMEYVTKIKESASFHEGMQTLRQLSFGLLDMQWHGQSPTEIKSVKEFENDAFSKTKLYNFENFSSFSKIRACFLCFILRLSNCIVFITLLIIFRHRTNIVRLFSGDEPKVSAKKAPTDENKNI